MTRASFAFVAALLLVAGPVFAQADVSGDWELTIQSPMGARTTAVSLKQDGEKITGAFKGPAGELPVAGTLTGDDLKLAFTLNVQGNLIDITMTGKVNGESITGKAEFGGFGEGEFTGKRGSAAAAAASSAPAVAPAPAVAAAASPSSTNGAGATTIAGTWDVVVKTGGGDFPATATLTDEAGKVGGTLATNLGELPVTGTIDGKTLKLSLIAKTPQGDIPVTLTGDLDGDAISNGKADFGGMGQGEWTAKRKQ